MTILVTVWETLACLSTALTWCWTGIETAFSTKLRASPPHLTLKHECVTLARPPLPADLEPRLMVPETRQDSSRNRPANGPQSLRSWSAGDPLRRSRGSGTNPARWRPRAHYFRSDLGGRLVGLRRRTSQVRCIVALKVAAFSCGKPYR